MAREASSGRRVLVTGHAGFIGRHVCRTFAGAGWDVHGLGREVQDDPDGVVGQDRVDLLDAPAVERMVTRVGPQVVVHLAAETRVTGRTPDFYRANTEGTANLLRAAEGVGTVERFVHISSRLVCRMGYQPEHPLDFCPPNLYGESKAESERIVRDTWGADRWVIVRPTGIWGPGFQSPSYRDFFDAVLSGAYRNIVGANPPKTFGYVKNTAAQILAVAEADSGQVAGSVLYAGDYEPVYVHEWARLIRQAAGGGRVRTIPQAAARLAAAAGSMAQRLGWKNPPLTLERLHNMRVPAVSDMEGMRSVLPDLPFTLAEGTRETVAWILAGGNDA